MAEKNTNFKLSKLIHQKYMKDDPLYFMIYPLNFGMKNHIWLINLIKCSIVLYLQIFNVIGIVYIVEDSRYLRRYISGILIQQVGISSYVLMMYYVRNIMHISESVGTFFLPFDATGKKVNQQLLRQCSLMRKFLCPLTFIVITAGHCGLLPRISNLPDYQFTVTFIQENFGTWSCFFKGLYYFCILSSGYSIGSLCCASIYLTTHLKFQIHLLGNYLQQISHGISQRTDEKFYQDVIQERLKSFVQAHEKITSLSTKFLDVGKWSVLVTTMTTSFLYAALIHILIMGIGARNNLVASLGLVGAAIVSYLVATSGQQLQNEYFNLYAAACQCKWNDWNVQNRKTLLMIMMSTSKISKLTSFGLFDLGNEIMLRMLKLTYSLVLLFVNQNK